MRSEYHVRYGPNEKPRVAKRWGVTFVVASSAAEAALMLLELMED